MDDATRRPDGEAGGVRPEPALAAQAAIDGARCVHGLMAAASCARCVTACPRSALALGEESLTLDTAACDGCGICLPACPQGAISLDGRPVAALVDARSAVALAACERSGISEGRGVVPCLDALGLEDAADLAEGADVVVLVTASGDCARCPRATPATLASTLERYNRIAASHGGRPLMHEPVSAVEWLALRARAKTTRTDVDQRRRRLVMFGGRERQPRLRLLLGKGEERADAIYPHVPAIDAVTCTGCDACARSCPAGAIALDGAAASSASGRLAAYLMRPAACTGCGLCVDVCVSGAVAVGEMQRVEVRCIPLRAETCSRCRAPFHEPAAKPAEGASSRVCPTCRGGAPRRVMYEVRS